MCSFANYCNLIKHKYTYIKNVIRLKSQHEQVTKL